MHHRTAHAAGLGLALLLAACARPAADQQTEAARLLQADREFAAASVRQGAAAAFFSAMAEDAIELPADAPPEGRAKVSAGLKALGPQVLDWTPQRAEVARSLDLGWTWGEWRLLDSAASGKALSHGKYLNIWKRQADGAWKLAVDIGNQAAPPAPAAAPPKTSAGDAH
jgi:ketosteroid isomerase-like protein